MKIILLDKSNLGSIGDQVNVKPGFARNYLIPKNKAVLATKKNLAVLEVRRAELEKAAMETFHVAEERAKKLANLEITIPVKVSEEGKLFGSIGMREILNFLKENDQAIDKSEINLPQGPIRQVGEHEISLRLHPDINVPVKIKVIAE